MYWMDFLSFDDTWCFWRGVFILPKTRCVSRNFTFNSLANAGGMRLGWRVAALHWSTWQNDARNSELSLGGLHNAHCVSIWIYSYFLGGYRFEIHNWARLCVGWRIQYHVQVRIKLRLWVFWSGEWLVQLKVDQLGFEDVAWLGGDNWVVWQGILNLAMEPEICTWIPLLNLLCLSSDR